MPPPPSPAGPAPQPIKSGPPDYPPLAKQARISGVVKLTLTIASDGTAQRLAVVSGHPLLIAAALEAVKQWVWSPSAAGTYDLDVPFSLPEGVAAGPVQQGVLGGIIGQAPAGASGLGAAPQPFKRVEPAYPPLAKQARISGTVYLKLTIASDGTSQRMEVISGHPLLVPSALEAVRQWAWSPSAAGTYALEVPFILPEGATANAAPQGVLGGIVGQAPRKGDGAGWRGIINKVDPVYPPAAREAGIQGVVHVVITIGESGHVETAEAIDGHPLLQAAAVEAVKQWVYEPGPPMPPGTRSGMKGTVVVPFSLNP